MTACTNPPNRPPPDVLERLIEEVAWARTCLLITVAPTPDEDHKERKRAVDVVLCNWYPHWGAEPLARKLNLSIQVIQNKARQLRLRLLRTRTKRVCYYCVADFIGGHKKFGIRCTACFKPYRAEKRQASIHENPLKARLRELAYQLYSRNRRKGVQHRISEKTLLEIWNRQNGRCVYTGRKMVVSDEAKGKRGPDTLSVDRIDSQKVYLEDNVVLCTWWANVAKHELSADDFVQRCQEVARYFNNSALNDRL